MQKNAHRLSIIGMGKLGSPMAAVMARAGFDVIGLDTQASVVAELNLGRAPVREPQLQEYLDQSQGRLRATTDYRDAVLNSDISFLILPTPSGDDYLFSNDYLLESIKAIGSVLREKTGYHLIVITSTTMPGSTEGVIRQTLERTSGRRVGDRLGLCYNPEFIALGSVIRDMSQPDFVLIGESDSQAGDLLERVHQAYLPPGTPVQRMSCVNAELAKISINTYVTTKISYANMLAELCEHLPGADVDVVTRAVGSDSRIGSKYLKGALGYGGPCFPRDNKAFYSLGKKLGVRCDLAEATDRINDHQILRLSKTVHDHASGCKTVSILGLAYKPDTGVIDASQGLALARQLQQSGYQVTVHDPMANALARQSLPPDIAVSDEMEAALSASSTVVLVTPWPAFREIATLAEQNPKLRTVIDPWRLLSHEHLPPRIKLVQMGRTPPDDPPLANANSAAR